jgi:membrane protease YdiL (CAAX protease family)
MSLFAEQISLDITLSVATLAVTASIVAWAWIAGHWRQGTPVPAYQPHRCVPWHGLDLLLILAFYLVVQGVAVEWGGALAGLDVREGARLGAGQQQNEHVITQLMTGSNVWVLLLCVASAAIVAPITEEFFFRVLLQGWLEALDRRFRRRAPTLRRLIPRGMVPIALSSLLFARLHFRTDSPQIDAKFLVFLLVGDAVARLLAMAFSAWLLHWRAGATAADLGWSSNQVRSDVKLGLVGLAAVVAPIYAMQLVLRLTLPSYVAPDPLPLFFFAVVLGVVYYRTHRLAPLVVLHAGLNGISLVLAWLGN